MTTSNEEFTTLQPRKRFPKWARVLAVVGIVAIIARLFCRGKNGCCNGESCSPKAR